MFCPNGHQTYRIGYRKWVSSRNKIDKPKESDGSQYKGGNIVIDGYRWCEECKKVYEVKEPELTNPEEPETVAKGIPDGTTLSEEIIEYEINSDVRR